MTTKNRLHSTIMSDSEWESLKKQVGLSDDLASPNGGGHKIARRSFLKGTGALIVAFSAARAVDFLPGSATVGAASPDIPTDQVDSFVAIAQDGSVTLFTGKVDVGQGSRTGLSMILAEELDVPLNRVTAIMGDTRIVPNQGNTTGSTSIRRGGVQIRRAGAAARQALLQLASERLEVPVDQLVVNDGIVSVIGDPSKSVSYGDLIGGNRFNAEITDEVVPKTPDQYKLVGQPIPRVDMAARVTSEIGFVQNLRLEGMLHGRVVRPRGQGMYLHDPVLVSVDESSVADVPGLVKVVIFDKFSGPYFSPLNFVGVICEREEQAIQAAQQLKVTWAPTPALPGNEGLYDALRNPTQEVNDRVRAERGDVEAAMTSAVKTFSASYDFPFQMHASMSPACAVADVQGGQAIIYSHTQGGHRLVERAASALGMPPEDVHVVFHEGAGTFGSSGYDHAGVDAALLSQAVGRPVRLQWMRHDEHGWEPYGPAHAFDLQAGLDEQGKIVAWKVDAWPDCNASSTGQLYDGIENLLAVEHKFDTYFLTSPLRAPEQPATSFAVEGFIDEIAVAEGIDPIEFRLRHLTDPREIEVLQAVAQRAGWDTRPSPKPGNSRTGVVTGRGVAYAPRGSNPETLVAQIAEVEVNQDTGHVRVTRFVVAQDCGLMINPDSVTQQVEGIVIQTTSRSMLEEVKFDDQRVTSLDWIDYPYLTFADVPEVDVVLINRPELPTGQVGEPACAPVTAAIANAIFDATGARVRQAPFTPERVKAALDAR